MVDVPRWGSDTPLVGRRDELATLTTALERASSGEPNGVLIAGEAGVGKSRLVRALREEATERGALVLSGSCLDVGHGLPYLPFREPVSQIADDPEYAGVVASIPSLAPLVDTELIATDDVDPAAVFSGILRLLERLAADRPVVLIIEDLHWADGSSRNLLRFLLARLRNQRLLVVANYRIDDVYRTHPLRPLLAELIRMPGVERLDLPPMPDDDLRRLLGSLAQSERGQGGQGGDLERIVRQADGNAFYAEELLASSGTDVPDGLSDLLLTRIERLKPVAQQIVRSASVAGRSVRYDLLRATLSLTDDEVDDGLRDVASHHVMHSDDGEVYVFRHALMREAAYTDLLPGERVRLHASYAASYEKEPTPKNAGARAHHLYESNQLSASIRASLEAAEFARRSGAPSQRLAHLENALELWNVVDRSGLPDQVTEDDVLRKAAAAAVQTGQLQRAAALGRAAIEASLSDDTRARSMVDLAATQIGLEGDAEAFALTSEALALAPEPTVTRLWALAAHARATLAVIDAEEDGRGAMVADYTTFDDTVSEALTLAHELERPEIEADVLTTMLANSSNDRQSDEGLAQLEHALALARSAGRADVEQRVVFNIAIGRYDGARIDAALHWSEVGRELARRVGGEDSVYAVALRGIEVLALYHQGSWNEALRRAASGAVHDHGSHVEMSGGYVRIARGDASFPPWVGQRLGIAPGQPKERSILSWLHGGSAMIEHAAWERDESLALEWYARTSEMATNDFHREPRIRLAALALWALADADDRVRAEADDLIDAARRGMQNNQDRWTCDGPEARAWLAMAEAEYARLTGDDPLGKYHAAYDAFAYGDRYRQAICQWRIAELYAAAGDRESAREHLTGAEEFGTEVGATRLLERVRDLDTRAGLGVAAVPQAAPASPLTARETEVLRLVAEGRSNKEIAESLFITTKTASVHVSNILAKAPAKTRTEAAAIGRREGWL